MANLSKSTQLLVRTALVTSSTIATIIGAQTLALTDQHKPVTTGQQPVTSQTLGSGAQTLAAADQHKAVTTVQQPVVAQIVDTGLKTTTDSVTIAHVAPTIIVLSGDNQEPASSELISRAASVPPAPQANLASTTNIQPTPQPTQTDPIIIQPTPQISQVNQQYIQP